MPSSSDSDGRKCCLSFLHGRKCYFMLQLNLQIHLGGKLGTGLTNLTVCLKRDLLFLFSCLPPPDRAGRQYLPSVRNPNRDEMQAGARAEKASLTFI